MSAVTAMCFSHKLGCLPENVLQTLLNDRWAVRGERNRRCGSGVVCASTTT
jgi:hypothetical protein